MNTPNVASTVFIVDDDEAVRDSLRWQTSRSIKPTQLMQDFCSTQVCCQFQILEHILEPCDDFFRWAACYKMSQVGGDAYRDQLRQRRRSE